MPTERKSASHNPIDLFEQRLDDVFRSLAEYQNEIVPAWISDLLGVEPAHHLRLYRDTVLAPAFEAKNAARRVVLEMINDGTRLDDRLRQLFAADRTLDAVFDYAKLSDTLALGLSMVYEMEIDPLGERGEAALDRLLSPAIPDSVFRLPIRTRRTRRLEGALELVLSLFEDPESHANRSLAYLRTVPAQAAARIQRDEEMADRDFLGVVPKERSLRSPDERRDRRQRLREALELDDEQHKDFDLPADLPDPIEILIARENQRAIEEALAEFRDSLTDDLAQLYDQIRVGIIPATACRNLGLPQSAANALRSRANRFGARHAERQGRPIG